MNRLLPPRARRARSAGAGVLLLALALLAPTVRAQEAARGEPLEAPAEAVAVALYFDNDAFSGSRKDEDYTGGFALSFSGDRAARQPWTLDRALTWIDARTGVSGPTPADLDLRSVEAGLVAFTPTEIVASAPIANDRPYASLIYLSNTRQEIDFARRSSLLSGLSFGLLGLPVVGNLQNELHELTGSDHARGWRHQISDGGEPTFKYSLTWQKYLDTGNPDLQATTAAGFSLGYITEAILGASLRTGKLRTPWWSFNVNNSNYGEKSSVSVPTSSALDELYVVVGGNLKLRAYNAFLQGQFRDSEVSYSRRDVKPVVYEAWIGVGGELSSGMRLAYLIRRQSSELKSGLADRRFTYGELIASYKF